MEIKDFLETVKIEGAGNGDMVFIEVPDCMSNQDFVKFGETFRVHADIVRADSFFPRCVILPPGVRAVVAHRHADDEIVLTGDVTITGQLAVKPDVGFPHG